MNPVARVEGSTGELHAHIDHYPFSHGVGHWLARHNRYSDMEAIEAAKLRDGADVDLRAIWSRDPNERRRALKEIFQRLPGRPVIKFLYCYIWRRGFLDGRAGFTYAMLQAMYEYMISCKLIEIQRRQQGLPV